jgi:lipoate-protein ligase A
MWELIIDYRPLKGSLNMAIDEFIFSLVKKEKKTILRFYQWEKPTISLGYFQKVNEAVNLNYLKEKNFDLVRRITGGKLVLHNKEITYSIASSEVNIFTNSLKNSYKLISQALCLGLSKIGINAQLASRKDFSYLSKSLPCFSYPAQDEIKVNDKKLVGSAQKREGKCFLQHGSIPIEGDYEILKELTSKLTPKFEKNMISLKEILCRDINFSEVISCLVQGFKEFFQVEFENKTFSDQEKKEILILQKEKYESPSWNFLF